VTNERPRGDSGDTPGASIRGPGGAKAVTPKPSLNLKRTPSETDESFFRRFLAALKGQLNGQSFDTWFKPLRLAGITDHTLEVYVPSDNWQHILDTWPQQIGAALRVAGDENLQLVLRLAK